MSHRPNIWKKYQLICLDRIAHHKTGKIDQVHRPSTAAKEYDVIVLTKIDVIVLTNQNLDQENDDDLNL